MELIKCNKLFILLTGFELNTFDIGVFELAKGNRTLQ